MPEPKIGHFRILRHLGRGSAMNAFMVQNEIENRTSALKILKPPLAADPAIADRFIAAAQAASGMNHPCIAAILSTGRTGPSVYAETAFMQGRPLRDASGEMGALDPAYCAFLAKQVAALLNFSHNAMGGAPHGGINPGNILLCTIGGKENVPALTDHGLLNAALLSETGFNVEAAGEAAAYLSPEQLRGEVPGKAADFYSLGVVLFELLTGNTPFRAETHGEIARMHAETEPPRLRDINPDTPPALDEIVWKCLRKNPAERFSDAGELVAALNAAASAPAAPPLSAAPETKPPADEESGPAAVSFLDVDTAPVRLDGKEPALINIYNAGDAPLIGSATSPARWLKISPAGFKVPPEEYFQIALNAKSVPPPDKTHTVVELDTDGGTAQVEVSIEADAVTDRTQALHALATVAAAALGGGYVFLGLASASMMGMTPVYILAGFAMILAGAAMRRDRGLAVTGAAMMLFCAWHLLNFSKDMPAFAGEAVGGILPAVIVMLAGDKLLKRAPSVVTALATALLVWTVVQAGADTLRTGTPGVSFMIEAPLSRFERRTVENTRRSALAVELPKAAQSPVAPSPPAGPVVMVVIKAVKANIRSEADTSNPVVFSARTGDRFELLGKINDWYEIRLPDNRHGWVYSNLCQVIEE